MSEDSDSSRIATWMVFLIIITLTAVSLPIQSPWNIYARLIAFILACLWIFRAVSSRLQDPYGNFHLKLNRPLGCTKNTREWLNMGFWQVSIDEYIPPLTLFNGAQSRPAFSPMPAKVCMREQ